MNKENVYNLTELLLISSVTTIGFLIGGSVGGTVIQGLGLGLTSNLLDKSSSNLKAKWLESKDGILNHDIQRALLRAFNKAMIEIEKEYTNLEYIKNLPKEDKKAIKYLFKTISDNTKNNFGSILKSLLSKHEIQNYLSKDPEQAESELWSKMNLSLAFEDSRKSIQQYYDNFHYDINDLKVYLQQNLHNKIKFWFGEELKTDSKETNKVWRAFQRLLIEGIKEDVISVKENQEENLSKLLAVETLILSLKDTIDKRVANEPLLNDFIQGIKEDFKKIHKIDETTEKTLGIVAETHELVKGLLDDKESKYTTDIGKTTIEDILKELPLPYVKGLTNYDTGDANSYYGRSNEIKLLVKRILKDKDPFLILTGPSGVGKSSFLKAGIIPKLQQKNWPCLVMRPTSQPFTEFTRTLIKSENFYLDATHKKPERLTDRYAKQYKEKPDVFSDDILRGLDNRGEDSKVILAIDQFEELLTDSVQIDDKNSANTQLVKQSEAYQFVRALIQLVETAPNKVVIIIAIREDSRSILWQRPWVEIAHKFNGFQYDVYEPGRSNLREIITTSAEKKQFTINNDLVTKLLSDLEIGKSGYSSALPMLSLALEEIGNAWATEVFKKNVCEKVFKIQHYPGGLGTILETKIKHVINDLLTEEQEALPKLFRKLVSIDSIGRPIRTQVAKADIKKDDILVALMDVLINYRLIVERDQTYELVHDILVIAWPELHDWFQAHKEQLFESRDLYSKALFWRENGFPASRLIVKDRISGIDQMRKTSQGFHQVYNAEQLELVDSFINASRKKALIGIIQNDDLNEALEILNVKEPDLSDKMDEQDLRILEKSYYAMFPDEIDLEQIEISTSETEEISDILSHDQTLLKQKLKYFKVSDIEETKQASGKDFNLAHYAAIAGQIPVLKRLHSMGINLFDYRLRNHKGTSPWLAAVSAGQISTVEWFLKHAEDQGGEILVRKLINEENNDKNSALIWAAYLSSSNLLPIIIKWVDNLDSLNEAGLAPLHYTSVNNVDTLLNAGANIAVITKAGESILHIAVRSKKLTYLEYILERNQEIKRANENLKDNESDDELILNDKIDDSRQSIDVNRLNNNGLSAFHIACHLGNLEAAQLLLAYGANPNLRGREYNETAIMLAAHHGKLELLEMFSSLGSSFEDLDRDGNNALHWALRGKVSLDIIEYLLKKGVSIEQINNKEETPLHIAVKNTQNESVKLMLNKINSKDYPELYKSILQLVKQERNSELVLFILEEMPNEPLPFKIQSTGSGNKRKLEKLSQTDLNTKLQKKLKKNDDKNWPIPFLLKDNWVHVDKEEASKILMHIFEQLPIEFGVGIVGFDQLIYRPLLFLKDSKLFTARARSEDGSIVGYLQFIQHGNTYTILDGTSPPIHKMREEQQMKLENQEEALEYLKLFCSCVHGDFGAFRILDNKDDLKEDLESFPPEDIERFLSSTESKMTPDLFEFITSIKYGPDVFTAKFTVSFDGYVEMENDKILQSRLKSPSLVFKESILQLEDFVIESEEDFEEKKDDEETINEEQERSILWGVKSTGEGTTERRLKGNQLKSRIEKDLDCFAHVLWYQKLLGIGEYEVCEANEAIDALLALSNTLPVNIHLNIDRVTCVRKTKLTCYKRNCHLYQAQAVYRENTVGDFVFIKDETECIVLDGNIDSITRVNSLFTVQLDTEKDVLQYAHLYFSAIQMNNSIFKMIDHPDDLDWYFETNRRIKDTYINLFSSHVLHRKDDSSGNTWVLDAVVQHGQKLSRICFHIDSKGTISGKDEIVLANNLTLNTQLYIDSCLTTENH